MRKGRGLLLFLVLLGGVSWGLVQGKYQLSAWLDTYQRPWAYGVADQLLVGTWRGTFTDPGKVAKTIKLEIFIPETDSTRWAKASRRRRGKHRRKYDSKQGFDGIATITSRLGKEEYEIYGSIDRDEDHQFKFTFSSMDEQGRILPNFIPQSNRAGSWQTDAMEIDLLFIHVRADGTSQTTSSGTVRNGKIEWDDEQPEARVRLVRVAR